MKQNEINEFVTTIFTFHPSGYFSSAAFTLQDFAEKRTIPTHGSVEQWASPQKQSDEDGRAALCACPGPKKLQQIQGLMKHSAILFWIQNQCSVGGVWYFLLTRSLSRLVRSYVLFFMLHVCCIFRIFHSQLSCCDDSSLLTVAE